MARSDRDGSSTVSFNGRVCPDRFQAAFTLVHPHLLPQTTCAPREPRAPLSSSKPLSFFLSFFRLSRFLSFLKKHRPRPEPEPRTGCLPPNPILDQLEEGFHWRACLWIRFRLRLTSAPGPPVSFSNNSPLGTHARRGVV